ARAQDTNKDQDPFKKAGVTDDKQDPRDQKIEQLKKAIQELESQKRAEKEKGNFKRLGEESPEVQKLLAAAADLKKQIGVKRQELDSLEAQLGKILAALKPHNIFLKPEHEKGPYDPKKPDDKKYDKGPDKKKGGGDKSGK